MCGSDCVQRHQLSKIAKLDGFKVKGLHQPVGLTRTRNMDPTRLILDACGHRLTSSHHRYAESSIYTASRPLYLLTGSRR